MRFSEDPILVVDYDNASQSPKYFRTTRDEYLTAGDPPVTRLGLDQINGSAARQFSETDLMNYPIDMPGQIYLVDLRQECHGFIDGVPMSWYGLRNHANLGKTTQEIADLEQVLIDDITSRSSVALNRIVRKTNGRIEESSSYQVSTERAETEKRLVERVGLKYVRLPVTDHQHPNSQTVNQFVDFVSGLPGDAWVHFHCRSGKGRSSTFMVLNDIFHNAGDVSLEDIICRNALIGSIDLSRVSKLQHKVWKNEMAKNRHEFLAVFYSYMTDSGGYGRNRWSEWLAQQNNMLR